MDSSIPEGKKENPVVSNKTPAEEAVSLDKEQRKEFQKSMGKGRVFNRKAAPRAKESPATAKANPAKIYMNDQFYHSLPFLQKLNARKSLGLDIDADKIRWILVKKTKEELQVLKWGVQKFPSEEKDRRKAMQIALENIKVKIYKKGLEVHVSIFSPEISTRQVVFPKMKKQTELKQAIYHKNENDLQNFNDKTIWNYEILDSFEEEGIEKLKIAVVAAPEEIVNSYLQAFNAAGIEVKHLIPRPAAIQAGYRRMIFRPGRDLIIDIGYDLTQMCFIKNGNVEFIRNVSIGARNLEVTIHTKSGEGTNPSAGEKSSSADISAQRPDEVRSRLLNRIKDLKTKQNPVLHTFFSEILRSLSFFQGKDIQQYIERIFVTGYGIRKESLLPYLKSRLNIPLFILTPQFEDRSARTVEYGEYFSTLGTTVQDTAAVDILPGRYKSRFLFKKINSALAGLIVLLFVVLGFLSKGQYRLIEQKKHQISAYQKEYELLNPVEGKYQRIQNLIGDVNKKNKELKSYIQGRPPLIDILRLFSNEVPKTLRLEKMSFIRINTGKGKEKFKNDFKYQLDVNGVITTDPLMADVTLINFVNHLIDLKYFKHIELLNKLKDPDKKITKFGLRLFL